MSDNKRVIKLVALDLDGTTLDSDHNMSEYTIETLRKFSARGVIITFATGRGTIDILKYFEILNLPQLFVPGVGYNGSSGVIIESKNGSTVCKSVLHNPLPEAVSRKLIAFAAKLGLVLQVVLRKCE
jgi:HAD superfamily hydrolase (TIGR01484 family)